MAIATIFIYDFLRFLLNTIFRCNAHFLVLYIFSLYINFVFILNICNKLMNKSLKIYNYTCLAYIFFSFKFYFISNLISISLLPRPISYFTTQLRCSFLSSIKRIIYFLWYFLFLENLINLLIYHFYFFGKF